MKGAAFQLDDLGRRGDGDLVEAVEAVRHPNALGAEIPQHFGHRLEPGGREDANELAFDAGWIGERSKQIEDRAGAELDPRRTDMAHRRMMGGRHHEADPGLADAAFDAVRRETDL